MNIMGILQQMSIGLEGTFSIFAEHPITTPRTEESLIESFAVFRPGASLTGVVEFNVDRNKWTVVPDALLPGVNAVEISLIPRNSPTDTTYVTNGFPLSDANPQFFDQQGNAIP
jgi:hypothetical protein